MRMDDLLQAAARDKPGGLAIVDHDDARLSWGDLAERAATIRARLEGGGVRPGDRVVIVLENCATVVAALFACSMMEAIAVPVNARLTAPELTRIVTHSDAAAVLLPVDASPAAAVHAAAMGAEARGGLGLVLRPNSTPEPVAADGALQIAVLLYTSGTTGAPKGAMLSHRAMLTASAASVEMRGMQAGDMTYLALPMSHVFGLITMLAIVRAQASVRLEARFDVARLYAALQSDVTLLPAVPQMHAQLFHHARAHGHPRYDRGLLRFVSSGGAPLDPAWKREAEAFYGIALQNGYGLTETAAGVCATRNLKGDADVSVGLPMLGSELRLDTTATGAEPDRGIGEIQVRGPQVMLGYFRDPEQTAAVFTDDGWFRTGDLGRMDDQGRLHIAGRSKELIIHSGFNVYPVEVEAALTEHPDVILAAVVGRKVTGSNEEVLAFVTTVAGAGLDEAKLKAFVQERLAPYKRPARIVIADALPAAPTGKILKSVLIGHFAEALASDG